MSESATSVELQVGRNGYAKCRPLIIVDKMGALVFARECVPVLAKFPFSCVCLVFTADKMRRPEFEFPGEQLAHFRILESAPSPQDRRRVMEDRTATIGQSPSAEGREAAKVDPEVLAFWFEGIELPVAGEPPVAILPDCPSVLEYRFRAAAESGRSAAMGKIHWRDVGSYIPELRVCPSHVIVKKDKVQVVRDWSNALYPLNSCLVTRQVSTGRSTISYGRRPPSLFPFLVGGPFAPPLSGRPESDVRRLASLHVPSV